VRVCMDSPLSLRIPRSKESQFWVVGQLGGTLKGHDFSRAEYCVE
jgi:hypothetical protein